jgi:hypothetical protein
VGRWLLDELRDEERWGEQFGTSQGALGKLAAEARAERKGGRATDLDPEKLFGGRLGRPTDSSAKTLRTPASSSRRSTTENQSTPCA